MVSESGSSGTVPGRAWQDSELRAGQGRLQPGSTGPLTPTRPFSLTPQSQLEAHQEEGMVVSHMAIAGVGIWIAFTSGSTLRLFHTETLKHLQDINIATPVHHMLPGTRLWAGGSCWWRGHGD